MERFRVALRRQCAGRATLFASRYTANVVSGGTKRRASAANSASPAWLVLAVCAHALACAAESGPAEATADGATSRTGLAVDGGALLDAAAASDAGPGDGGGADAAPVPHPVGCASTTTAGHHVFTCSGLAVEVEVPPACTVGGCGLVLDVHGLTMDGNQEDRSTGLRALAESRKVIVVQPTASTGILGPSWNPSTDDDKVWAAVREIREAFVVDRRRVHVTGFSQGGAMTFRLLCAHADEIASAAPIAAADAKSLDSNMPPFRLDCPFDASRSPTRPLSILHMHGTKDGLVPIAKGRQQRDAALAWLGPHVESTVSESATHKHRRFASAMKGVVYETLEHDGAITPPALPLPVAIAGHCFPGGTDLGPSPGHALYFSCAAPMSFVWGELLLDFFAANPMP